MSRSNAINDAPASGGRGLGSLPFAAATLVALNGLYMALVAFGNINDFGTNQAFVQHVLAMDTINFGAESGTNGLGPVLDAGSPGRVWRGEVVVDYRAADGAIALFRRVHRDWWRMVPDLEIDCLERP